MAQFKDYFSEGADAYARQRPTYPDALAQFLASQCTETTMAWDCGCGNGQLSHLLANHFDHVIATDASAAQIEQTQPTHTVSFHTAPAEATSIADHSADLITVAQAAHWFDRERFYQEVMRVAKPNAIVALMGYGLTEVNADVDQLVRQLYREKLDAYWPPERRHIERAYQDFDFPFSELEAPAFSMQVSWRRQQFVDYLNTWSAVKQATKALGANPVETWQQQLENVWPADRELTVRWPMFMRSGRID